MPYTPTVWQDGVTSGNQTHLNNLETQYTEATLSFNTDLLSPQFVLTGIAASKDGTNANQLDVTSGTAYVAQADTTIRQRKVTATNFTTATPSTTYYLDLNSDGSWSWGTSHSGFSHYLSICQVTTDGSGNISVVTDARVLNPIILDNSVGTLMVSPNVASKPALWATLVSTPSSDTHVLSASIAGDTTPRGSFYIRNSDGYGGIEAGAGTSYAAHLYAQSGGWKTPESLTIAGSLSSDSGSLFTDGNGNLIAQIAAAPSSNVAPLLARVTGDTSARAGVAIGGTALGNSGYLFVSKGGVSAILRLYTDGTNIIQDSGGFQTPGTLTVGANLNVFNTIISTNGSLPFQSQQSGAANGFTFKSWSGSAAVTPFSVGGQFASALAWVDNSGNYNGPAGGGVPTTRNGTATSVPIYTGTTTPSNPPTGSLWSKA